MYELHGFRLKTGSTRSILNDAFDTEAEAKDRARELIEARDYDEIHVQENGLLTVFQIYRGPSGMVSEF